MNRYALVDKRGKNRGTCSAKHFAGAEKAFVKQRGGKEIPEGWAIAPRGGAKEPEKLTVKLTIADLPQVQQLLEEARATIKEQGEKIDNLTKDVGRLHAENDDLSDEVERLVSKLELVHYREGLARELQKSAEKKLSDITALLRSWEITGATTVAAMVYGLRKVLDRKD